MYHMSNTSYPIIITTTFVVQFRVYILLIFKAAAIYNWAHMPSIRIINQTHTKIQPKYFGFSGFILHYKNENEMIPLIEF